MQSFLLTDVPTNINNRTKQNYRGYTVYKQNSFYARRWYSIHDILNENSTEHYVQYAACVYKANTYMACVYMKQHCKNTQLIT